MLEMIRRHTTSIFVKFLLGLLIVSFAAWGITDVFKPGGVSETVATVGEIEIGVAQVKTELDGEINRLRVTLGGNFSAEQARALGIPSMITRRIVDRTLYDLGGRDLGITISDDLVRAAIRRDPRFNNQSGQFDRGILNDALRNSGLNEAGYLELLRGNLARSQYMSSFDTGQTAPAALIKALYLHRNELRVAEVLKITDASMTDISDPDEATIEAFHKENAARFTAPEFRTLTYISLTVDDLAKEISVSQSQVQAEYESRADEFIEPEKRTLQQMVMPDEDTAKRAHEMLETGGDFLKVAKDVADLDPGAVELGRQSKYEALPELADAVFALAKGAYTAPIQTPIGWHIIRVTVIEPVREKTLEDVRDILTKAIAREKAVDSLFGLANQLEDALGGGASLEEAAIQINSTVNKISAINAAGSDPSGVRVNNLPAGRAFLDVAFSIAEGQESPLTESANDGYFFVRVDGITSPALRNINDVRGEVIKLWQEKARKIASQKAAEDILEKLVDGEDIFTIAANKKLEVTTTVPFSRTPGKDAGALPANLITTLFGLTNGKSAIGRTIGGYTVARLKETIPANPSADSKGMEELKAEISGAITNDLVSQLGTALQSRYPVSIKSQTLNQLF